LSYLYYPALSTVQTSEESGRRPASSQNVETSAKDGSQSASETRSSISEGNNAIAIETPSSSRASQVATKPSQNSNEALCNEASDDPSLAVICRPYLAASLKE
jgi:hypothetical protein